MAVEHDVAALQEQVAALTARLEHLERSGLPGATDDAGEDVLVLRGRYSETVIRPGHVEVRCTETGAYSVLRAGGDGAEVHVASGPQVFGKPGEERGAIAYLRAEEFPPDDSIGVTEFEAVAELVFRLGDGHDRVSDSTGRNPDRVSAAPSTMQELAASLARIEGAVSAASAT